MKKLIYSILTSTALLFAPLIFAATEAAPAQKLPSETSLHGGLLVYLGLGDGQLAAASHAGERFLVHGLDTDAQKVAAARQSLQAQGRYGPVSVELWDGQKLPYADNLVNLLVINGQTTLPEAELLRVLVPHGQVVTVNSPAGAVPLKLRKPWPTDLDEWTHFLHGPDNNPVSRDTQVGAPRRLRWVGDPLWLRSHAFTSSLSAMVTSRGRLFYIFDEGPTGIDQESVPERWMLIARDAFNGVLLWKRPLATWGARAWNSTALRATPGQAHHSLVAEGDRLFVTLSYGAATTILDAATGKELAVCEGSEGAQETRCVDGTLIIAKITTQILAYDAQTGRRRWSIDAKVRPQSVVASKFGVCFQDQKLQSYVCYALADGKLAWKIPCQSFTYAVLRDDRLLLAAGGQLTALAADTGKPLWSAKQDLRRSEMYITKKAVWFWQGEDVAALDLFTGEPAATIDTANVFSAGHHHRCYLSKATDNYLITQNRGAEFLSLTGGEHTQNDWLRGACSYGVMPANGLLYVPPHPCYCYPGVKLTGFNAFAPAAPSSAAPKSNQPRLERGPAFEQISNLKFQIADSSADWPTYRHDISRSGAADGEVPAKLSPKWEVALRGPLTAPVAGGGSIFVAATDEHTLHALDAQTGKPHWQFTAGGRIDSPPTIHGALVLFGSADGYAYCLRASDGALVWRFRAAPEVQRIVALGQLESPWRVHGSVLLANGLAYFTAGRSSFLDGGLWIYGLDPRSGEVKCQTQLDTWERLRDDAKGKPFYPAFHIEGAASDILVSQDGFLYLGQYKFDAKLVAQPAPYLLPAPAPKVAEAEAKPAPKAAKAKPAAPKPAAAKAGKARAEKSPEFRENPFNFYMQHSHPGLLEEYQKAFGGLTFGERRMGLHLMPMTGFLDNSAFGRTTWTYSEVRPGVDYNRHDPDARSGDLLVVQPELTFLTIGHPEAGTTSTFVPGKRGFLLAAVPNASAATNTAREVHTSHRAPKKKETGYAWSEWIPVRVRSMIAAGKTLFVFGTPDAADDDALAGRKGGVLRAYDATAGKQLAELRLASPPIFDGLIAANGCLYWTSVDGKLICYGGQ